MPDKLYQECRSLISGCRAIFEDLRAAGIETLPRIPPPSVPPATCGAQTTGDARTGEASEVAGASLATGASGGPQAPPESLDDIQRELNDCRACSLCQGGGRTVFGAGNPQARLVLVCAAPDGADEPPGDPCGGEAGQLLERILFAMRLSRDEVYLCNLVKCSTPEGRDPQADELHACSGFLTRQLRAVAPEMILSLGRFATESLLPKGDDFAGLRGRWHSYNGIPLLPTLHPADLLDSPAGKHQVWTDVKQVMHRLQESGG